MLVRVLFACSILAACERPERTEPTPAEHPSSGFVIHEWGLIEVHPVRGELALVTAGVPPDPSPPRYSNVYKPVIYAHLQGVDHARFSLSIDADALEVWPPTPTGRAAWNDLTARAGACGPHTYPAADQPCASADGLCEAPEGASYESSDGACLELGEAQRDFLLYRARIRRDALPFDVGEEQTIAAREGAHATRLVRIGSFIDGVGNAAVVERSSSGPLPELSQHGREARALVDELLAGARERGLSDAEAETFARVWRPGITGRCSPGDAVYYWLEPELVDRLLPMHVEPEPLEIRRAFLVRIVFDGPVDACLARPIIERRARVPIVRASLPQVRGALSAQVVRRTLQRNINAVRFCYEQALNNVPLLAGNLTVAFEIDARGSVTSARVATTTLGNEAAESCIAAAVRRMSFPRPTRAAVSVEAPIELSFLE